MLIGLSGPKCAGKNEVASFLVHERGFTLLPSAAQLYAEKAANARDPLTPAQKLLSQSWRPDVNIVMKNMSSHDPVLPRLLKRPYFLLVYIDAPIKRRYERWLSLDENCNGVSRSSDRFLQFVEQDDYLKYGGRAGAPPVPEHNELLNALVKTLSTSSRAPDRDDDLTLSRIARIARIHIVNDYDSIDQLRSALRAINLNDNERLRPSWDAYFMSLARLASQRTNCMKRRVGCVIARDKRLVSSGYNGTPSGLTNCSEGGCNRCNGQHSKQGVGLDLCVCLHAEENAIIEAGRERCQGATLYASLFPCILCSKKIVQAGISRVVYDRSYAMDEASENLLRSGGVVVNRFSREQISHTLTDVVIDT